MSLTDSQSLGSCSAGSATSTLSLQNNSGSTVYVTVEYSLNGGSSWTVHNDAEEADNLTISNGQTNTSLTVSVADGSAIQWRYKSSDTSGNWTGLSYITASDMNSSTVDCPNPVTVSGAQSLGSCSSGAKTSDLTVTNNSGSTAYLKVEYKIDNGSWETKSSNYTSTNNSGSIFQQSVPHGSAITWRFTSSDTANNFTGLTPTT